MTTAIILKTVNSLEAMSTAIVLVSNVDSIAVPLGNLKLVTIAASYPETASIRLGNAARYIVDTNSQIIIILTRQP